VDQVRVAPDARIVPGRAYAGLKGVQNLTSGQPGISKQHFSPLFKFPILSSERHLDLHSFSKCNSNIKEALAQLHNASPFKKGNLCQKQQLQKSMLSNKESFQSENVIETVEEEEEEDEAPTVRLLNIQQPSLT